VQKEFFTKVLPLLKLPPEEAIELIDRLMWELQVSAV